MDSTPDPLNALEDALRIDPPVSTGAVGHRVEYLYAIDTRASREAQALVVHLLARVRRADGTWERPVPATITDDAALQTTAIDRRLLAPFLAAARSQAALTVTLSTPLALEWTPQAARANRLILREHVNDQTTRLLAWDDGPQWSLDLNIEEDDDDHLVRPMLVRGHDHLPVTGPVLVLRGLFITHERVALFDPGPSAAVIPVLRRTGAFVVSAPDTSRFAQWLSRYGVDPEQLPSRLRIAPVHTVPVPHLRLETSAGAETSDRLFATLAFVYDGTYVPADGASPWFDEARQRHIHRNPDEERQAEMQLVESGVTAETGQWQVAAKTLPAVVRELTGRGWTVQAGGVPYRPAGVLRLSVASGIDWFDLDAVVAFGDTSATLPELLAALDRGERTILLGDGSRGVLPEEWLRRYTPLVAIGQTMSDGKIRYGRHQAALLDALLDAQTMAEVQVDEAFLQLRERLASATAPVAVDPPAGFTGELRHYQREALGWLQFLRHFGFGGCLADDMGLGKTVTVLAELARVAATSPRPSLAVVPRSVVHNWMAEARRFTPALRVLDYSSIDRRESTSEVGTADLVLVTYGTVRRDIAHLAAVEFEYVILDEAQTIKNASTEAAKAVRLLNSRHRLALSGTPLENHLGELWSLFEFLNPGLLGKASRFRSLTMGRKRTGDDSGDDPVALVAKGLRPFLLRRTKAQVAQELPARTEQTLTCVLSPRERSFYDALRRHYRTSLFAHVKNVGLPRAGLQVLEALLRLRQAACHPGLIAPARQHEPSSKVDLLLERLQEVIEEGHKALVFSQFTSLLALVKPMLDREKITYEYLDGRTRDRAPRVERFQTDPHCHVFLISLKAGGVGLNLTAADYVFLLDPWWNPAVEAQAIDRSHRIGQTNEVFAYRLIAEDTVEEKVLALQASKRALADAVLSANPVGLAGLSTEDLEFLLG